MQSQATPFCLPALAAERSTLAARRFICSPRLPSGMSKVSLKGASTTMTDTSAPRCLASDNPADRARSEGLDPSVAMRIWRYIWVAFPLRRVTRQHDRPQAPNASCGGSAWASRIDIMPDRIVLMSIQISRASCGNIRSPTRHEARHISRRRYGCGPERCSSRSARNTLL